MTRPLPRSWYLRATLLVLAAALGCGATVPEPVRHQANGTTFKPTDVDFARPVYRAEFDRPEELRDWVLESGASARIEAGRLVLRSAPPADPTIRRTDHEAFYRAARDHVVCWLKREIPADFLLEVALRPEDKQSGLNIVFFSFRGRNGESVLDPTLAKRNGTFIQYHTGDLDGYHVSYWAAPRSTTHIRKNRGFHMVTASDLNPIADSPPEIFDVLRIYKRAGMIRVMVNDQVIVAWDDDGKSFGPVIARPGWIGLRQMGYTLRTDYERIVVYPLRGQ
jgi:hypothetical protein